MRACSRTTICWSAPLFEGALEDECLKEGIGVIPYYSLAAGS